MPAQANLAGVDVLVAGTAVLTETVSVNVFSDVALINLIASDTVVDHPRGLVAAFRWSAVPVNPDQTYYMELLTGSLVVGAQVSNTIDPYNRGDIIAGGGSSLGGGASVPVPGAGVAGIVLLSVIGSIRQRRRRA